MLGQRIGTAVLLLFVLVAVLRSGSQPAFLLTLALFFGAACWEAFRLFDVPRALPLALLAAVLLVLLLMGASPTGWTAVAALCAFIWAMRLAPALKLGLPEARGARGTLFTVVYTLALLGCFIAIAALYQRSALYLVSVMAIVWVADIGAYFVGRAFGKHKLAPSISPGKSWEGALGGWLAVLLLAGASVASPLFASSFPVQMQQQFGWPVWVALMSLLVAASIVGDLFESLMKRRAGVKDSSGLLPGHGGVLDRIDALIPVMPLALLITARL